MPARLSRNIGRSRLEFSSALFRAYLHQLRNFRGFLHAEANVRTPLQIAVVSGKILVIKGFGLKAPGISFAF
jgi:hypothetical protein